MMNLKRNFVAKETKVDTIDCSLCRISIKDGNDIHCMLRVKGNVFTFYSKVTIVVGCSWFKLR